MAANLVKFSTGTAAEYAALASKNADTLYFVTDAHQIYKGDVPFGGSSWEVVTALPVQGEANTNYIVIPESGPKSLWYWNGSAFVSLLENVATISKNSTDAMTPTAKAVYDFVVAEVAKVDASGIGASISALEDRIADVEDGKADSATTLAGYGITDAYTKTETDSVIASAVADASHLKRAIVAVLPATGDAEDNTIYMVAKTDGEGNQNYDEYMLVNGAFEKIGDTAVDLTGYATEDYVDNSFDAAKTQWEAGDATVLESAADYADSLADNYATAAQGALADSALQADDIAEGNSNGTINIDGTDVAVHGLGSAAYTEATAYDLAGTASTAEASAKAYTDAALTWNSIA